jgi:MoaA/NifB/PqqE/SkfB family radical SAM enzyme
MKGQLAALSSFEGRATSRVDRNSRKYVNPLNKALGVFFKQAVTVSLRNPAQSLYFVRTVRNQRHSAALRASWKKRGVHVPPIMIFSITNRCNLHCRGCYHQALRDVSKPEMSESQLRNVVAQAQDLGVSFMVLAGGEPLVREDILGITRDFPDIIFFMFTNGLLITDEIAERFKSQRNLVPLISLEGYGSDTDERRGEGIFARLQAVIEKLKRQSIFFGTSITLTRQNYDVVTAAEFVKNVTSLGGKVLLFAEYTPAKPGTEDWVINDQQRSDLNAKIEDFRRQYSALFINVPGDEKDFGGCLSAGRGFVHVSAEGDLEPCPFAPYSDSNLTGKSLLEGLKSPFLEAIRGNDQHLEESGGACALWTRREWVKSLLPPPSKG